MIENGAYDEDKDGSVRIVIPMYVGCIQSRLFTRIVVYTK